VLSRNVTKATALQEENDSRSQNVGEQVRLQPVNVEISRGLGVS